MTNTSRYPNKGVGDNGMYAPIPRVLTGLADNLNVEQELHAVNAQVPFDDALRVVQEAHGHYKSLKRKGIDLSNGRQMQRLGAVANCVAFLEDRGFDLQAVLDGTFDGFVNNLQWLNAIGESPTRKRMQEVRQFADNLLCNR